MAYAVLNIGLAIVLVYCSYRFGRSRQPKMPKGVYVVMALLPPLARCNNGCITSQPLRAFIDEGAADRFMKTQAEGDIEVWIEKVDLETGTG